MHGQQEMSNKCKIAESQLIFYGPEKNVSCNSLSKHFATPQHCLYQEISEKMGCHLSEQKANKHNQIVKLVTLPQFILADCNYFAKKIRHENDG